MGCCQPRPELKPAPNIFPVLDESGFLNDINEKEARDILKKAISHNQDLNEVLHEHDFVHPVLKSHLHTLELLLKLSTPPPDNTDLELQLQKLTQQYKKRELHAISKYLEVRGYQLLSQSIEL